MKIKRGIVAKILQRAQRSIDPYIVSTTIHGKTSTTNKTSFSHTNVSSKSSISVVIDLFWSVHITKSKDHWINRRSLKLFSKYPKTHRLNRSFPQMNTNHMNSRQYLPRCTLLNDRILLTNMSQRKQKHRWSENHTYIKNFNACVNVIIRKHPSLVASKLLSDHSASPHRLESYHPNFVVSCEKSTQTKYYSLVSFHGNNSLLSLKIQKPSLRLALQTCKLVVTLDK